MEQSLISIIIPVYNGEKYLRPCIDSILHQTSNMLATLASLWFIRRMVDRHQHATKALQWQKENILVLWIVTTG